ncbi:MAG: hypothetical protein K6E21_03615 [Bacilli bacterium]|nr:hypothetical protein [Bacilli bacterium]
MAFNLRAKEQFIICDDFDGKRRCQSAIFSNDKEVKAKLSRMNSAREHNKKVNPTWYLEHKISDYYIVKIFYQRM